MDPSLHSQNSSCETNPQHYVAIGHLKLILIGWWLLHKKVAPTARVPKSNKKRKQVNLKVLRQIQFNII